MSPFPFVCFLRSSLGLYLEAQVVQVTPLQMLIRLKYLFTPRLLLQKQTKLQPAQLLLQQVLLLLHQVLLLLHQAQQRLLHLLRLLQLPKTLLMSFI